MTAEAEKEYRKKYYLKNRERFLKARATYVAANKEKCLAADRAYHARIKDDPQVKQKRHEYHKKRWTNAEYRNLINKQTLIYQKLHRKESVAKSIRWQKAHPEVAAKWRESNKDKIKHYRKKAYDADPKKHQEYGRKWRELHPEYFRAAAKKRRALQAKATVNLRGIEKFMEGVKAKELIRCYYCGENTPTKTCHFDHIVPISKGGAHSVENLCATCPTCNLSKHDKPIDAWIRVGQQILSL